MKFNSRLNQDVQLLKVYLLYHVSENKNHIRYEKQDFALYRFCYFKHTILTNLFFMLIINDSGGRYLAYLTSI